MFAPMRALQAKRREEELGKLNKQLQAQAQRARGGLMETQKALVCLSACVDAAAAHQALESRAATLGTSIAICD